MTTTTNIEAYKAMLKRCIRGVGECPYCHGAADENDDLKPTLMRLASEKHPGRHFWKCGCCDGFYNDDDGKIGEPFGYDPDEVKWDLAFLEKSGVDESGFISHATSKWSWVTVEARRHLSALVAEGFIRISNAGAITITDAGRAVITDFS